MEIAAQLLPTLNSVLIVAALLTEQEHSNQIGNNENFNSTILQFFRINESFVFLIKADQGDRLQMFFALIVARFRSNLLQLIIRRQNETAKTVIPAGYQAWRPQTRGSLQRCEEIDLRSVQESAFFPPEADNVINHFIWCLMQKSCQ